MAAGPTGSTSATLTRIHIRIRTRIQIRTPIRTPIPIRGSGNWRRSTEVTRTIAASVIALLTLTGSANEYRDEGAQTRSFRELVVDLAAQDPAVRARAA